jgi:pectin methylesterase-like acyl-CoA thioesterase
MGVSVSAEVGDENVPDEASAATIYVPDDYSTIQAAVDAANACDIVIVRDGTYRYSKNVVVRKPLTVRSENESANCVVQTYI